MTTVLIPRTELCDTVGRVFRVNLGNIEDDRCSQYRYYRYRKIEGLMSLISRICSLYRGTGKDTVIKNGESEYGK